MGSRAVIDSALRDRIQTETRLQHLRAALAAAEARMRSVEGFIQRYRDYNEQSAEQAVAAEEPPGTDAWLVLESMVGERRIPVPDFPLRIGSDRACDLVFREDLGVGGEHAVIWQQQGEVILRVLDRERGAIVNGRPTNWACLEDGDVVELASVTLRVWVRDGPPPGEPAEAAG